MIIKKIIFVVLVLLIAAACNEKDKLIPPVELPTKITANDPIESVVAEAKSSFATDAELSAIYGRNVGIDGKINLVDFSELKAFVYVVQSDEKQSNEFFVPVAGAGPVKSPVNFDSMLQLINDENSRNIMSQILGTLSSVKITASSFPNSDESINIALANGGSGFISQNNNSKIDMFLVPSKSINPDSGIVNSADWIVHFYNKTNSFLLWINSGTGAVAEL